MVTKSRDLFWFEWVNRLFWLQIDRRAGPLCSWKRRRPRRQKVVWNLRKDERKPKKTVWTLEMRIHSTIDGDWHDHRHDEEMGWRGKWTKWRNDRSNDGLEFTANNTTNSMKFSENHIWIFKTSQAISRQHSFPDKVVRQETGQVRMAMISSAGSGQSMYTKNKAIKQLKLPTVTSLPPAMVVLNEENKERERRLAAAWASGAKHHWEIHRRRTDVRNRKDAVYRKWIHGWNRKCAQKLRNSKFLSILFEKLRHWKFSNITSCKQIVLNHFHIEHQSDLAWLWPI